jgi:hypothetical protein
LTITPSCNLPEDYRKLAVGDLGRTAPGERRPLVRRADPRLPLTMRRNHVAGERMFVDHGWRNAGSGRSIHQRSADRHLFLAGLGYPLDPGLDRLERRQIKSQRRTRVDHSPGPQCGDRSKLPVGEAALLRIVPRQRPGAYV